MKTLVLALTSLLILSPQTQAIEGPAHMHKSEFMDFCVSKHDSKAYCECTLDLVEADIAKRKESMERIVANEDAKFEQKLSYIKRIAIKKRLITDESEVDSDCDIIKAHAAGEISDQKYQDTFSDRKAGFYKHKLVQACTQPEMSITAQQLKNKDYEHINAPYIISTAIECKYKHLK